MIDACSAKGLEDASLDYAKQDLIDTLVAQRRMVNAEKFLAYVEELRVVETEIRARLDRSFQWTRANDVLVADHRARQRAAYLAAEEKRRARPWAY